MLTGVERRVLVVDRMVAGSVAMGGVVVGKFLVVSCDVREEQN